MVKPLRIAARPAPAESSGGPRPYAPDAGAARGRCQASGPPLKWVAPFVLVFMAVPMPAAALELSGGIGLGGILAGTVPRFAVSPHASLSWRMESGLLFAAHELMSIMVARGTGGVGVYNQLSGAVGYAWERVNLSVGPTLSIYSMPACGTSLCGRVAGVAPGGHAQINAYFAGPLGVSVNANIDWVGGESLLAPGGVAAMVVAGPVLRWTSE